MSRHRDLVHALDLADGYAEVVTRSGKVLESFSGSDAFQRAEDLAGRLNGSTVLRPSGGVS